MPKSTFGSVRELPSGKWQARYTDDATGRQRSGGVFNTRAEADKRVAELRLAKRKARRNPAPSTKTHFKQFAEAWLLKSRIRIRSRSADTRSARTLCARIEAFSSATSFRRSEKVRLDQITPAMVETWYYEHPLLKPKNRTNKARPGSNSGPEGHAHLNAMAKAYRLLRAILETAGRRGFIADNPCDIELAGIEPTPDRPYVTIDDVAGILAALDTDRWRRWQFLILLFAFCGPRFSEAASLQRRDLNVTKGVVQITNYKAREIRPRGIGIPAELIPFAIEHLELYVSDKPDALLFTGPLGGKLNNGNFRADVSSRR